MAIRLKEEGVEDFVVWERDPEVGGTWWANTYPGCQCDIPSHLYSFSFALNPEWRRTYATQPEIEDYLRRVVDGYGLRPHVRTSCAVTSAEWDEAEDHWRVRTERGDYTADVLVAAPGPLSEPSIPDIPGLESFEGTTFHTADWNHDHDLTGRRVAVLGTGASAIQAVPEIQPIVESLAVFQRTPPWVVPHRDRPITDAERRIYNAVPALQRLVRAGVYLGRELLVPGLAYRPSLMRVLEKVARKHLRDHVADPGLRERLTPSYTLGCKRILPSNRWYPAITKPNVELVTDAIDHIRPDGIVTTTGELRQVDTIVFATGFHVTDVRIAHRIVGAAGRTLDEVWDGSPRAYRGTTVAGFPNLFFLVGPNTGLGHNSIVFMIEAQVAYVMDALRAMDEEGAETAEVRPEAARRFNEELDRRMERTVWTTGCSSWYLDDTGRNATLWPDWTFAFRSRTSRFDRSEWALRTGSPDREPVAA
jgi:cation diffusion facilitator CzcD-associated flavoprotein CzcO